MPNKINIYLIFALPLLLTVLATAMFFGGFWLPSSTTNHGELMVPTLAVDKLGIDQPQDDKRLWRLVVVTSERCEEPVCQQALYVSRQVHVALGKDADRVQRWFISPHPSQIAASVKTQHPNVEWLQADQQILTLALGIAHWPNGALYIIDPLGNMMMRYPPKQDGGDLLSDLQRLLKVSGIG